MAYSPQAQKEYAKAHYLKNKELYASRARVSQAQRREENRKFVQRVKEGAPCSDCGGSFHFSQMEFDHLRDKDAAVSRLANAPATLRRLAEEIDKCELVCANCHRLRTWERLQAEVV